MEVQITSIEALPGLHRL